MALPYENSTSGERALGDIHKRLPSRVGGQLIYRQEAAR